MNDLTVKEFQKVLGISLPTARKRVKIHGRFLPPEEVPPNGLWVVSYDYVSGLILQELAEAQKKQARLLELNGHQ